MKTILDKFKKVLMEDKSISTRELNTFIERESNNTLFLNQSVHEMIKTGYYQILYKYNNFNFIFLIYFDLTSNISEYNLDTKFKIKNIVILLN